VSFPLDTFPVPQYIVQVLTLAFFFPYAFLVFSTTALL
jgi:hypothetical protein